MTTPVITVWATLKKPFHASMVDLWDGALAPEQQDASLWLYDAIASRNVNLVKAMVRVGARVNTRLKEGAVHPRCLERTPMDLALWMETHDDTDQPSVATDETGQALPGTGIVQVLLAAGARAPSTLRLHFEDDQWEKVGHPTFLALEHHLLDRLAQGESYLTLTRARRDEALLNQWTSRFDSVVPVTERHFSHQWLHRAVQRHHWAAFERWWAEDGVVSVPRTASVLGMMWHEMFHASPRSTVQRPLRRALAQLRVALLREEPPGFRREIISTLGSLYAEQHARRHAPSIARAVSLDVAWGWVNDLIAQRPLESFHLLSQEWRTLPVDRSETLHRQVQQHLLDLEGTLLRSNVKRPALATVKPSRSRL